MRILQLGLLAAAILITNSGCETVTNKTVLRVAAWGGAGDDSEGTRIEREVYAEFERRHPGVEIQIENIPGGQDYARKMLLAHIAHSEPDVMKLDASSAAVFIGSGAVKDLNPYIQKANRFSLDDYYPNVTAIAQRKDKIYAIPLDFTPIVLYYNKRMFDAAGVEYPKPGWTWDDFLAKSKALTKGDQYGFTFTNWMPGWLPLVWTGRGDVFDSEGKAVGTANETETVDAITFLRDLVTEYKVAPSLSQMAAEGAAPFANAQAAMEISGHWNLITLSKSPKVKLDDICIAPLPIKEKGRKPVTVIYEAGLSIGANCRHPDLAWEFIQYMTSAEVQRKIQKTNVGVCARKDIAEERAVDDREKMFLQIIPSGRMPWGAVIEGYDFVESEGQKMMDSVLKSGKDPEQALEEFAKTVDRQLEKE